MKNSASLRIVSPNEMSLLGLMLGGILGHNLDSAGGAERASKMDGRLGVTAGRMSLTIEFKDGVVSVLRGLHEPLRARVSGSLSSLMRISLGQGPLMSFLSGEVSIKGNPFFALKAIPLFKAREREREEGKSELQKSRGGLYALPQEQQRPDAAAGDKPRPYKDVFSEAVPSDRMLTDAQTLRFYSRDMTENPAGAPELVIKVETAEEAEAVVRAASANRVPITPRIAGTNLGGLSLAPRGGAIVDLTGMNRIIEIFQDDMLAVIEPGVTFGQLVEHLKAEHPDLTIGIPLSPPNTSIVANCLLDGLGNLSLVHGAMGEWIAGLEVVLASGKVIRTGAWAVSDIPFSRSPLPDLTGLFVSWQGTTGLVTKMAVELKPRLPMRKRLFILTYDRRTTYHLMRRLARLKFCDDIGGLSWPTGKMLYGIPKPKTRDPDEPEFFTYVDVSAGTAKELTAKLEALTALIETVRRERKADIEEPFDIDTLCRLAPEFTAFAEFPTDLKFLTENPGGGLTWVGTYGPMSRFDAAADLGIEIMERFGFPPVIVSRPMKGGHFGVLRFIETFDRDDDKEVEKVRECNAALLDMVLDQGFIPYKTPAWAVERLLPRMWPGTHDLMREIRKLMDPAGIMNPGRWRLDPEDGR